jgi:predicted alpha/beta-fold hydrolase
MEYHPPLASRLNYKGPTWLPGGNLQTIWPAVLSRKTLGVTPQYQRERWLTPDEDFIDVDWRRFETPSTKPRPLLVLFHGLEGSSASHYAQAFAEYAAEANMDYVVPHFRGCSGEINLAPRAYHSGDHEEIGWVLRRLRQSHTGPLFVVGISLGGNALLRWAEESGHLASQTVNALAAICAPLDLAAGGHSIGKGFNKLVYTGMFLKSMKPKALKKLVQHPRLFDKEKLLRATTLYEFDNVFTAPLHGFQNTEDYWKRGSAKPQLAAIKVPALVINTLNDPFLPAIALPRQAEVGSHVVLWHPAHGGHVGFPSGHLPGHVRALPDLVGPWLQQH